MTMTLPERATDTRPDILPTDTPGSVHPVPPTPAPEARGLTAAQVEELGRRLDEIRDRVLAERGEADAAYIRGVIDIRRRLEISGRALLFAGILPPAWLAGTAMFSVSKILENMEIGHNVMHGQWDWMRDPKIHSSTWEWDNIECRRGLETLAQLPAPHLHQRGRQGPGRGLRHPAAVRGAALEPVLPGQSGLQCPALAVLPVGVALHDHEVEKVVSGEPRRSTAQVWPPTR